ncbi:hypothetical protein KAR91_52165 [Candidatus Pacearchaeota archaeon]|nr:hypothetical protein [Candidatus Pacearchaeota archaeon]
MKLIIAGGRDFKPTPETDHLMKVIFSCYPVEEVVSGKAKGADRYGEDQAKLYGKPIKPFPADWNQYGKSAGFLRNTQMAEYADAVVLFHGGKGTASMRKLARKYKLMILHDDDISIDPEMGLFSIGGEWE